MEATNKTIVNRLKRILEGAKRNWAKELPGMLWAYQTTPRRSIRETLFSMTYGAEAVIPVELSSSSMRIASFSPGSNDARMIAQLDLLKERRDMASI